MVATSEPRDGPGPIPAAFILAPPARSTTKRGHTRTRRGSRNSLIGDPAVRAIVGRRWQLSRNDSLPIPRRLRLRRACPLCGQKPGQASVVLRPCRKRNRALAAGRPRNDLLPIPRRLRLREPRRPCRQPGHTVQARRSKLPGVGRACRQRNRVAAAGGARIDLLPIPRSPRLRGAGLPLPPGRTRRPGEEVETFWLWHSRRATRPRAVAGGPSARRCGGPSGRRRGRRTPDTVADSGPGRHCAHGPVVRPADGIPCRLRRHRQATAARASRASSAAT